MRGIQFGKIGKQIPNEKRKNEKEKKNNESRKGSAVNCLSSTLAEKKKRE